MDKLRLNPFKYSSGIISTSMYSSNLHPDVSIGLTRLVKFHLIELGGAVMSDLLVYAPDMFFQQLYSKGCEKVMGGRYTPGFVIGMMWAVYKCGDVYVALDLTEDVIERVPSELREKIEMKVPGSISKEYENRLRPEIDYGRGIILREIYRDYFVLSFVDGSLLTIYDGRPIELLRNVPVSRFKRELTRDYYLHLIRIEDANKVTFGVQGRTGGGGGVEVTYQYDFNKGGNLEMIREDDSSVSKDFTNLDEQILTQIFKKRFEIEMRIKDALSFIMPPEYISQFFK